MESGRRHTVELCNMNLPSDCDSQWVVDGGRDRATSVNDTEEEGMTGQEQSALLFGVPSDVRRHHSHAGGATAGLQMPLVGPASGFFNILKSCLGVGILATPAALSQSGWLLGGALLAVAAAVSSYGCFLLNACAHRMGGRETSFFMLFQRTFPRWSAVADLLIVIVCWGSVVGYLIVAGDDMAELAVSFLGLENGSLWASPNFWRFVVFWGIIAPLTILPRLSMLKYSSVVGVSCVLLYCTVSLLFALDTHHFKACGEDDPTSCQGEVTAVNTSVLSTLSLYFFIYSMQMKLFLVYNELSHASIPRMTQKVTSPAVGTALLVIMTTAVSAYATYGDAVADNFLLSYPSGSGVVRAAVMGNVISVTTSGPLTLHPARASAITLINFGVARLTGKPTPSPEHQPAWHRRVWAASTLLLLVLSFVPALFVRSLGRFLGLVGAVAGTGLIMWCPGFAFLALFRHEEEKFGVVQPAGSPPQHGLTDSTGPLLTKSQLSRHRVGARGMGWGGILLMVVIISVDMAG